MSSLPIPRYREPVSPSRVPAAIPGGRRIHSLAAATLVLLIGCSGNGASSPGEAASSRPSSPAQLTITSPLNGEVIHGSDVPISVKLTGATVVPATTTTIVPTQGHIHVSLDGELVAMNFGLSDTVHDVQPGPHVLQVEFVASDHLPFDPRVIAQTTFESTAS
jgi:hypothetical protein